LKNVMAKHAAAGGGARLQALLRLLQRETRAGG